jgi:hypothetical protein
MGRDGDGDGAVEERAGIFIIAFMGGRVFLGKLYVLYHLLCSMFLVATTLHALLI